MHASLWHAYATVHLYPYNKQAVIDKYKQGVWSNRNRLCAVLTNGNWTSGQKNDHQVEDYTYNFSFSNDYVCILIKISLLFSKGSNWQYVNINSCLDAGS